MSGNGASARGVKQVGYFDCPGGGQVVVDGRVAFIAHMKAPHGTTLVDVSDPARPRQLASIEVPPGTHSHKVRAANGLMLVNREAHGGQPSSPPACCSARSWFGCCCSGCLSSSVLRLPRLPGGPWVTPR